MAKKKLRSIVVNGQTYYWSFISGYKRTDDPANPFCCHDIFTAYAETSRSCPLRITFITRDDAILGGSLRTGATIGLDNFSSTEINLHTPKWAAVLIQAGLTRGWQPNAHSAPFILENGVELLTEFNQRTD